MSKSPPSPQLKIIDINDDWSSHPMIEWISARKTIFLWAIAAFFAALILASRFAAMRTLSDENDFFHAQTAFTQFQKDGISSKASEDSSDLKEIESIMLRHPEIKPKYQGPLAQTLLISGQIPQAQIFADDIFSRTQAEHLQLYQTYTQISLLAGQAHYEEAVNESQKLKQVLDQLNDKNNPILYVFNLIRLAILYQQTGQAKEEIETWELLQNQPNRIEAVAVANQAFKMGQASLNQYIAERQKALNSNN